ncbi:hypothetical protein LUZ61_017064 [Rhynchospora tenuis]|uniref:Jacalin-type lectin domain-containing protein n=1 Tax=Rhynchospora tenuis TaxID=198213 RepID=A0AAD6EKM6_9POAL|nr:hypothetical protein LUZ61_017064 [Rhynchospora tenuis]
MASASNGALKKVGPYGGDGGEIRDMDPSGITRIVKIGIRHGGAIDALIVHFERNGHEESTDLWGTDGGELTEISFEEDEYIMTVKGHVGTYNDYTILTSLVLETNLRRYGPYGAEEGQSFELSAEGGEIIGFHGRSGQFLDAIGVYVKAFVKLGPLGGSGGDVRDMDPSVISRIVKIGIRHGGAIDGIVVHYERNGHEESTDLWGSEGGELTEISFEANEYIIDVRGHVGTYNDYTILKSLRLQTNLRTYGPYGAEEGQYSFDFSVQGGQIIGFHGRSGQFIDAMGVYVKGGRAETKIVRSSGIGVCYGMIGNNLPSRSDVVNLYQSKGISAMRIYFPDRDILNALRGTNIDLIIDAPDVGLLANGSAAADWVHNNIIPYDGVSFKYIAVGNEVMDGNAYNVLPAMSKIYDAICSAGLQDKIKVSTAVRFDVLTNTYPPSNAVFSAPHMGPIVEFLRNTGAPLLANIYPYFSHAGNPGAVGLNYALFHEPKPLFNDGPNNQLHYQNVFDAMVDSMYYALEKAGGPNVGIVVSESGWPTAGGLNTTIENARTYIQNLINHVRNGTPKRPGKLETYIFAMFNENQKTGNEVERHFGLFYPDQTPVYSINFN